jgi:hypothetical protein
MTFKFDFEAEHICYNPSPLSTTEIYEAFEPKLNAGEVELPDIPKAQEQLLTLVIRGAHITHQAGDHDDWANALAGVVYVTASPVEAPMPQFGVQSTTAPASQIGGWAGNGSAPGYGSPDSAAYGAQPSEFWRMLSDVDGAK